MPDDDKINKVNDDLLYRVLDSLDACIYVTDLDTFDILYINDKMTKSFGYDGDLVGKKCWQKLQSGMTGPCSFCPAVKLKNTPEKEMVWEELNSLNGCYYRKTDRIIKWSNNKNVHIQHSVDISKAKKAESAMEHQFRQQEVLTNISMSFASYGDFDNIMSTGLNTIGRFLNIDAVCLSENRSSNSFFELLYIWKNEKSEAPVIIPSALNYEPNAVEFRTLNSGQIFAESDCSRLSSASFYKQHCPTAKSIAHVPVLIEGVLWGLLSLYSFNEKTVWTKSELIFAKLVSSIFSSGIERKIIEKNLEDAQQTLSTMIDSVPVAIYWKDADLKYLGCNRLFEAFAEKSKDQIIGKTDAEILPVELSQHYRTDDNKILIYKKPLLAYETEHLHPDGVVRWLKNYKVPIFDSEGSVEMVLGVFEDITKQKMFEFQILQRDRQLERSIEDVKRATNAKSEFLSRMSHEIRTPMNAIIGMTHIAQKSSSIEKIMNCLDKVDVSSRHLLGIINDILDMSKIEADKLEFCIEEFSLEKLLVDICGVVLVRANEKSQELSIEVDSKVAQRYKGDALRISQVITNLLTNAIKFSPENSTIHLNISLLKSLNGVSTLQVYVKDSGIGLSDEQAAKLFAPFEQADGGIARKFGGTGLGLAICKKIVELMGGAIWVNSRLSEGSTFTFTMQLEDINDLERVSIAKELNPEDLRVLVIDDSIDILDYFTEILVKYGIRASAANSGQQALAMMKTAEASGKAYNIIFVDWRMPGMDGIQTAKLIAQEYPNQSFVILISIAEWSNIEKEARSAGISKFLSKPLFPDTIIKTINEVMGFSIPEPPKQLNLTPDFSGRCILVAEDIDINREVLAALVEPTKVAVEFAENGLIATNKLRENIDKYDLVLMDVHMPVMDGYEAVGTIRGMDMPKAKEIPIVAMTANAFLEDVEKCKAAGMDDHIAKPINETELIEKLMKYLESGDLIMTNQEINAKTDSAEGFLPYVDMADGLKRLFNNYKLYAKLLGRFQMDINMQKVCDSLAKNDIPNALEAVHTLKGTSANLSLKAVNEASVTLEADLKAGGGNSADLLSALKQMSDKTQAILGDAIAFLEKQA